MVLAILGVIVAVALPSYHEHLKKADILQAKKDIMRIADKIDNYFFDRQRYPASLADVDLAGLEDPWGNAYKYLRIEGNSNPGVAGQSRKDKNLVPINSDYDLYSQGPDGRSISALTAQQSRDDIIRANDGRFIGTAADY